VNPNTVTRFYQVRVPKRSEWARIWITEDGCVSILSDYGNYGYWFGGLPECGMRAFLVRCGDDYLSAKFSAGKREIDCSATELAVKCEITSRRREGDLGREEARKEWGLMRGVNWNSELEQWDWARESKLTEEPWRCFVDRYPIQVTMFLKELWPLFVEQLKAELAAEAPSVGAAVAS
jgi:hypothetical protein